MLMLCNATCCVICNNITDIAPTSHTVFVMLLIAINRAEHVCATVISKHNYMLMCNHKIVFVKQYRRYACLDLFIDLLSRSMDEL